MMQGLCAIESRCFFYKTPIREQMFFLFFSGKHQNLYFEAEKRFCHFRRGTMAQRMVDMTFFSYQNNILDWFLKETLLNGEPDLDNFQKQQLYSSLCFFKLTQSKWDKTLEDGQSAKETEENFQEIESEEKNFAVPSESKSHPESMDLLMQAMQTLQDIDSEAQRCMDEINVFKVNFMVLSELCFSLLTWNRSK
jgi:hypothetical protein